LAVAVPLAAGLEWPVRPGPDS